ncbi:MAG: carbohydrate ABC transporter permease [Sphaerochaetaceae bacterium]|nr:carbohydrate ABC transporter permease [Sphaerochaetaceae bacterium]MDC7237513.1 carbohydrate ABC transporter permease [Sphaerochaetaceae bacterium]
MNRKHNKRNIVIYHLLSILFSLIFVLPILWALIASFRPEINIFQGISPLSFKVLSFFPFTLDNYIGVFKNEVFSKALLNTFFVATTTVIIGVIINAFAGFSFATMDFYGKKVLFSIVVASFLVPGDLLVIPTYNLIDSMGLIDTKIALILPLLGNGMVIFMFIQFFSQIPKALSEAAVIDGASYRQILIIIYAPLTIPTIIGASLIMFLAQWEAFLWPLVVSRSINNGMIQLALSTFTQQYGTLWGLKLAASSLLCFIPLIILMPLQKYYISSIASSAIKG